MVENLIAGHFTERNPERISSKEGVATFPVDPLELKIDDDELVRIVDQHSDDYELFYENKYDLFARRKKNEIYYFGRQVMQKEKERLLKDYESKYMDNVLYEIGGSLKPLLMTRLPDLIVLPGNDSDEAMLTSQEISKAVDTQIKDRQNRRVLGLAIKHLPVYFTSVIKVRWDPEIDDYIFENIHPDLIECDYTSTTKDADSMSYVSQICPWTVEQVMLKFPKKKEEFIRELQKDGLAVDPDDLPNSLLATTINVREVWFDEYQSKSDTEVEKISGLLWKYKDCILGKMKNPNYDYEGEKRYFSYDPQIKDKRALNEQELNYVLMTGQLPQGVSEEQVYHNYFRHPRKPYYFMGYDQWGKQPYDETSWIEQNLGNQKAIDKRGKQLEETLDKRGHHVFSKESGLTPADVEELDLNDPDEDLVVDGDVNRTHAFMAPERPAKQEFDEMTNLRNRMYAISHSNAIRGQIQTSVATTNQIAREGDFTSADDMAEDTINDAAQWMADWAMQFIKLRYTEDHFRDILGVAGEAVYIKLNRNMVGNGMIVKIKASGTDKLRAQNNAMEMAKMQMTDPYTFFTDMGLSDPEGRTEKLILAKMDPQAYLQKIVKGINTSEALAKALMNAEQVPPPGTPQQPGVPPTAPGQPPQPTMSAPPGQPGQPQAPTVTNTAQVPTAPPINPPQPIM
jgi:hypothetical protein